MISYRYVFEFYVRLLKALVVNYFYGDLFSFFVFFFCCTQHDGVLNLLLCMSSSRRMHHKAKKLFIFSLLYSSIKCRTFLLPIGLPVFASVRTSIVQFAFLSIFSFVSISIHVSVLSVFVAVLLCIAFELVYKLFSLHIPVY